MAPVPTEADPLGGGLRWQTLIMRNPKEVAAMKFQMIHTCIRVMDLENP